MDLPGKTEKVIRKNMRGVVVIPKLRFAPDAIIVDLVYFDVNQGRTNNLSLVLSWRYRMNSAFDPDPAVGSGAIPGFTEWAAFYNYYRVLHFNYDISLTNNEAFPLVCVTAPTNTDVGTNYASTNELLGQPYSASGSVGAKGGMDTLATKGHLDLGGFIGNSVQYSSDSTYAAAVTTNPTNMAFFNVGFISSTAFTAAGIMARCRLVYRVLFYDRKIVTT